MHYISFKSGCSPLPADDTIPNYFRRFLRKKSSSFSIIIDTNRLESEGLQQILGRIGDEGVNS